MGYSTTGLVAQMREQDFTWKQARRPGPGAHEGGRGHCSLWGLGLRGVACCWAAAWRRARGSGRLPPLRRAQLSSPAPAAHARCASSRAAASRLDRAAAPALPLCAAQGDVTVKLAEAYGFCWGVERAVQMAYEVRGAASLGAPHHVACRSPAAHARRVHSSVAGAGAAAAAAPVLEKQQEAQRRSAAAGRTQRLRQGMPPVPAGRRVDPPPPAPAALPPARRARRTQASACTSPTKSSTTLVGAAGDRVSILRWPCRDQCAAQRRPHLPQTAEQA